MIAANNLSRGNLFPLQRVIHGLRERWHLHIAKKGGTAGNQELWEEKQGNHQKGLCFYIIRRVTKDKTKTSPRQV